MKKLLLGEIEGIGLYKDTNVEEIALEIHGGGFGFGLFDGLLCCFFLWGAGVEGRQHLGVEVGDESEDRLLGVENGEVVDLGFDQHFFVVLIDLVQHFNIEFNHVFDGLLLFEVGFHDVAGVLFVVLEFFNDGVGVSTVVNHKQLSEAANQNHASV